MKSDIASVANPVYAEPARPADLHVVFCGERTAVDRSQPFSIGASATLDLDVASSLPARLLEVRHDGGLWLVEQTAPGAAVVLTDPDRMLDAVLRPGRPVPLILERHVLHISARGCYEVELHLTDAPFAVRRPADRTPATAVAARVDPSVAPVTPVGPVATRAFRPSSVTPPAGVRLTREQRQLLAVLAAPVLERGDRGLSEIPSSAAAAGALGWPVTKFNRKLDTVCGRLTAAGFDGLHGGADRPALNRRTRLVQVAVTAGLVGPDDLDRLGRTRPTV